MMKKKNYTTNERTKSQFQAMALKERGYHVNRIVKIDEFGEKETIAFGYSKSMSPEVKEAKEVDARVAKEENYDFIYWN